MLTAGALPSVTAHRAPPTVDPLLQLPPTVAVQPWRAFISDLGCTQAQGYSAAAQHVSITITRRLLHAVVPDLASDSQTAAAQAAAGAGSTNGVATATRDFSCGSYLGGFLLSEDSRVFVLGAVAPDGCFLLAHESDVAG